MRSVAPAPTSESLLRRVIDALPIGVGVVDRAGDVLFCNAAVSRIWGELIRSGAERYRKGAGRWHQSGKAIAPHEWPSQRTLLQGETVLGDLIDIVAPDGRRKTIVSSSVAIRDERGAVSGAVIVNEDVTERVRADAEMARQAGQQAAIARLSLSALGGEGIGPPLDEAVLVVAHTLRTKHCMVLEGVPGGTDVVFRAGTEAWKEIAVGTRLPMTPAFLSWFSAGSRAPVVAQEIPGETGFVPPGLPSDREAKNGIHVPILGHGRSYGVLTALTARTLCPDEVNFVWSVANVLAASIEQKRAAGELRAQREHSQALSRRLLDAQEAERRAIARELHDDFGAMLSAIKLNLQKKDWAAPETRTETLGLVDQAIQQVRDLAMDLRPSILDDLGLAQALRWYAAREMRRAGLELGLFIDDVAGHLPAAVETACFRLVQEALTNIVRHSGARHVEIKLQARAFAVCVEVRDDGKGFDARKPAASGKTQGLSNMQERAELAGGGFEIESAPGKGTAIRASFPILEENVPQ